MLNDSLVANDSVTQKDMLLDTATLAGIGTIGLFGNALIIVCVIVHKKMKNVTSLFVANLAAADLLLAVLVAPGSMRLLWRQRGLPVSPLCQLFGAALYFSCAAVVNFSALIALTRYIVICKPHLVVALFRHKRAAGWCIGLWCYTVLQVAVPSAARLFHYTYNPVIEVCHLNYTRYPVAIAVYINGFCFLPCLTACIVCYALIFWALRRSRRKLTRHMSSTMSATFLAKKLTRERRATLPLFVSLLSFFVHWLPVMIMFGLDSNFEKYNPKLHRYLGVFSIASACDNWIIYGLMNRNFANGYRLVLCYCCRSKQDPVKIRHAPGRAGQSRHSAGAGSGVAVGSRNSRRLLQHLRCSQAASCHNAAATAPMVSELEDYSDMDSWHSGVKRDQAQQQQQHQEHDWHNEQEEYNDEEDASETDEFDRINEKCCGAKHRAEAALLLLQSQQQLMRQDTLTEKTLGVVIATIESCETDDEVARL